MLIKLKSGEEIIFKNEDMYASFGEIEICVKEKKTNEIIFWAPSENVNYWSYDLPQYKVDNAMDDNDSQRLQREGKS